MHSKWFKVYVLKKVTYKDVIISVHISNGPFWTFFPMTFYRASRDTNPTWPYIKEKYFIQISSAAHCISAACRTWNNGKEVSRFLDSKYTMVDQTRTANVTDQSAAMVVCLMSPPANGRSAFTYMCTICLFDAIIIYLLLIFTY